MSLYVEYFELSLLSLKIEQIWVVSLDEYIP